MFFPERIKSIKPQDRVLEIGPGGNPHPRADFLLEKIFDDPKEAERQRSFTPPLRTNKKVVFYDGGKFPFKDKEFNYIICSHVLEHVTDIDYFLSEVFRVGEKGYFEYPTVYYDYVYNIHEHKTLLMKRNNVIYWILKEESGLDNFKVINKFFYDSLVKGYNDLVEDLKVYLFQGFEWFGPIESKRVDKIELVCYSNEEVELPFKTPKKSKVQSIIDKASFFRIFRKK